MSRFAACLTLALLLIACSSVRLEESTELCTDTAHRGGVVSYRFSKEQGAARKVMEDYCNPRPYRIVSLNRGAACETGEGVLSKSEMEATAPTVRRVYVRFECEPEAPNGQAVAPGIRAQK